MLPLRVHRRYPLVANVQSIRAPNIGRPRATVTRDAGQRCPSYIVHIPSIPRRTWLRRDPASSTWFPAPSGGFPAMTSWGRGTLLGGRYLAFPRANSIMIVGELLALVSLCTHCYPRLLIIRRNCLPRSRLQGPVPVGRPRWQDLSRMATFATPQGAITCLQRHLNAQRQAGGLGLWRWCREPA